MIRLKNIILVSAFAAGAFAPPADAETARWVVQPIYDSVEQLSDDLYKVKRAGKTSVIDSEGRMVVASADSITPFSEGLALVMSSASEGRMRLDRILRADKSVATVADEAYVEAYPFFSEGLLPVANKGGKVGYVDQNGMLAIPFKYSNPHPFSNGLAAVSKGKGFLKKMANVVGAADIIGKDKVFYINPLGGELKLPKEIGDIFLGTTFKDGEALVINKARQYCIINTKGQLVRIEPSVTLRFDERYALTDLEEPSQTVVTKRRIDGPDVFSEGKLLGYRKGSHVIVPAQFTDAEPFSGGRARAARFGAYGVLGLIGGNVSATMKAGALAATGPDVESIDLEIVMPKEYAGTEVDVEVTDKDNKLVSKVSDADDGSGRHVVSLMLPKGRRTVRVMADNLEVWNSSMAGGSASSSEKSQSDSGIKFSFSSTTLKANSKDAASLSITISNSTSETISGPVKMSGATPSVKSVRIPAGGKKTINAYFSKVVKKETRTVTISVGGHSSSRRVTLQPFFNF